jgi:ferredoxin
MPIIIFEASEHGDAVQADRPQSGALIDVCDEDRAPVPFSCRGASCGTCRIVVLEGHDLLLPPEDEELDVLDVFGDSPPKRRLACCAKFKAGAGQIRVKSAED